MRTFGKNVSQMFRKIHLIMITYKFYIDKRTVNSANGGVAQTSPRKQSEKS